MSLAGVSRVRYFTPTLTMAGTTAMAQIERGSNRIYGVERDRPFLRKYAVPFGNVVPRTEA